MSRKKKSEIEGADEGAVEGAEAGAVDTAAFRRGLAAVVPGSRPFGSMPAARMRLEEACHRVLQGAEAVKTARDILEDLKAEKVTGKETTGAHEVLGADLPAFEAFVAEAEEALASLAGEPARSEDAAE